MVKNLITGVGGFVASHLSDYLIEKKEEIFGTYRWTEDLSRINHIKDKINLIPCDLLDLGSCIRTIKESKPDYIYHLAAQSYVTDSYSNPGITLETNVIGTLNLFEAIRTFKESEGYDPIVHVCSTSEVYGLVKKEDLPIKETQPFNPSNPYAVGKLGGDMLGLMYWTNYKITRPYKPCHAAGGANRLGVPGCPQGLHKCGRVNGRACRSIVELCI